MIELILLHSLDRHERINNILYIYEKFFHLLYNDLQMTPISIAYIMFERSPLMGDYNL